jgi:hypothetical protein
MNDIGQPLLSTPADAAPATATKLAVPSLPRKVADPPVTADDRGIRLTWRRLDRLASAATLGMVLVSPRTTLLMARILGPRIPPSGSTSASASARSSSSKAACRQGIDR